MFYFVILFIVLKGNHTQETFCYSEKLTETMKKVNMSLRFWEFLYTLRQILWCQTSCRVLHDNGRKCKGEKGRGRAPLRLWLPVPADIETFFLKVVPFSHNLKMGTKPLAQGPVEDIQDLWTHWAVILTSVVYCEVFTGDLELSVLYRN